MVSALRKISFNLVMYMSDLRLFFFWKHQPHGHEVYTNTQTVN
jgi:hypothetical protein